MIASRTRGTCSRAERCRQRRNGFGAAAERAGGGPADLGIRAVKSPIWDASSSSRLIRRRSGGAALNERHRLPPIRRWRRRSRRPACTNLGAAVFHQFARHPPHDRGGFRLGDGSAAAPDAVRVIASAPSRPIPVISTPTNARGLENVPARSSPSAPRSGARDSRAAPAPASHSGPMTARPTTTSASPRPI